MKKALKLAKAFGYLRLVEVELLRRCADALPPDPIIINIGAGAGTSALTFAEARPDAHVITVDISAGGPLGGMEGERNAFDDAHIPYPEQILGRSAMVGRLWNRGLVDMVFVDGDHSTKGVEGDVEGWLPHIKIGGIIAFHDYGDRWPRVVAVVDKTVAVNPDYMLFDRDDTTIAFIHKQDKKPDVRPR
jgi:hypothetical protein